VKITFEGREWELDTTRVSYQQAMVIQMYTGMSIGEWEDSIDVEEETDAEGKPTGKLKNPPPEWLKSIGSLYWLMHAQAGDKIPIADMEFDFGGFMTALMAGMAAQLEQAKAEAAAGPDPTLPSSPSSPTEDPPSPGPGSPTATIPQLPAVVVAGQVVTGSG
jgi:hypothetical protein